MVSQQVMPIELLKNWPPAALWGRRQLGNQSNVWCHLKPHRASFSPWLRALPRRRGDMQISSGLQGVRRGFRMRTMKTGKWTDPSIRHLNQ